MKKIIIALLVAVAVGLGILFIQTDRPSSNESKAPDDSVTITNGGNTWRVGAVQINGTNVKGANLRIEAATNTNAPDTNPAPK